MAATAHDLVSTRVVRAAPDDRLGDVAAQIGSSAAEHCVVVDPATGAWIGLIRLAEVAARTAAGNRLLADLISPVAPLTLRPEETAESVAALFVQHGVGEAVVVNAAGRYTGLVTAESVLAWMQAQEAAMRRELEVLLAERQQLTAVLERKVEQRTAELRGAVEEFRSASLALSHDVRGPLRSIRSFAELLLAGEGGALTAPGMNFAGKIVRAAERLDLMAERILGRAQRTFATGIAAAESVDLNEVLEDAVTFHRRLLDESGAAVTKRGQLHTVAGHYVPLLQIVANLLSNAVKYAAEGSRAIVEVWSEEAGDGVVLCVKDNGRGIARRDTRDIFEPFVRGETGGRAGMGLGLSIVKHAAAEVGGAVAVRSEEGAGSLFVVTLRKAPPAAGEENTRGE